MSGAYRKAIDRKPDDAGAHTKLGTAQYCTRQNDEAIDACRKVMELKPNDEGAHAMLSNGLLFKSRWDAFARRKPAVARGELEALSAGVRPPVVPQVQAPEAEVAGAELLRPGRAAGEAAREYGGRRSCRQLHGHPGGADRAADRRGSQLLRLARGGGDVIDGDRPGRLRAPRTGRGGRDRGEGARGTGSSTSTTS